MPQSPPGQAARPLSPHVQIWRWHITMFTSIAHRATGMALYVGALILAGWAIALAMGPDAYASYMALLGSPLGKLVLFGLTLSIFYHLGAGVRHLVWDAGWGFDPKVADAASWAIIAFAVIATAAVWGAAAGMGAL